MPNCLSRFIFAVLASLILVTGTQAAQQTIRIDRGWTNISIAVQPSNPYTFADFYAAASDQGADILIIYLWNQDRWLTFPEASPLAGKELPVNRPIWVYSVVGGTIVLDGDPPFPCGPTLTPTSTPIASNTPVPTLTPVPTDTPTPTDTPLPTGTPTQRTPSPSPTDTPAPSTATPTETLTSTPTPTPTQTHTIVPSPTSSPTQTSTSTPVSTSTPTPTQTPSPTPTPTPLQAGDVAEVDPIVGTMRFIPSGSFTQGKSAADLCDSAGSDESQFTHILTRDFYMMETEVTQQMWADLQAVANLIPDPSSSNAGIGGSRPVQQVSWFEAQLFANLLSQQRGLQPAYYKDGQFTEVLDRTNYLRGQPSVDYFCDFNATGFRLPSEGEWEYAARAGTTGPFWVDDQDFLAGNCGSCSSNFYQQLQTIAVFCANSGNLTSSVGSKLANPWNLLDMHGNVLEWCFDASVNYPDGTVTNHVAEGSPTTGRATRGGAYVFQPITLRSARRNNANATNKPQWQGFRLVRTARGQ